MNLCWWVVLTPKFHDSAPQSERNGGWGVLVCSQLSDPHLENIYNTAQFQLRWLRMEAGIPGSPLQVALVTWHL